MMELSDMLSDLQLVYMVPRNSTQLLNKTLPNFKWSASQSRIELVLLVSYTHSRAVRMSVIVSCRCGCINNITDGKRTTMEISRIYLLFVQSLAIYVIMFNIESLYCIILLNKIKSKQTNQTSFFKTVIAEYDMMISKVLK